MVDTMFECLLEAGSRVSRVVYCIPNTNNCYADCTQDAKTQDNAPNPMPEHAYSAPFWGSGHHIVFQCDFSIPFQFAKLFKLVRSRFLQLRYRCNEDNRDQATI